MSVLESHNREHGTKIDWLGLITLVIALPCLILSITQGDAWGWASVPTIASFIIAIVMFVVFYVVEMRTDAPIIQFHLFANRIFITSVVATFSLALFYCLAFFLMPLYLHSIRNETAYMIGIMLLPTTAAVAILSPVVGRVVDIYGPKIPLTLGFVFFVFSALLQTYFTENTSLLYILFAFVLMGIGWACILGPSTVASLSAVPESMGAVAMGSSWTMHNIGGAIGLGVGVVIYRLYAQYALLNDLAARQVDTSGSWIVEAVANPDSAILSLQQHTHLQLNEILPIFHHFFISGYQAAMWLLFATSLFALVVVFFGMKKSI